MLAALPWLFGRCVDTCVWLWLWLRGGAVLFLDGWMDGLTARVDLPSFSPVPFVSVRIVCSWCAWMDGMDGCVEGAHG